MKILIMPMRSGKTHRQVMHLINNGNVALIVGSNYEAREVLKHERKHCNKCGRFAKQLRNGLCAKCAEVRND